MWWRTERKHVMSETRPIDDCRIILPPPLQKFLLGARKCLTSGLVRGRFLFTN